MVSPYSSSSTSAVANSGDYRIDALLSGVKWGGGAGTGVTLQYSFPGVGSTWGYTGEPNDDGYAPLSLVEQAAFRSALNAWAEVANIQFVEVADTATNVGDIRVAWMTDPDWGAWAYYPSSHPAGGDVWLNSTNLSHDTTAGGYTYLAMIHELGHALGLKHPFEGSSILTGPEDTRQYSVMSYTYYGGAGSEPVSPMLYDILAIQSMYGANMSTRAGNDTYTFNTPQLKAIWDAGGIDTFDLSGLDLGATVNLNAGTFSSIGRTTGGAAASGNIAIAFNVTIENVVGSAYADNVTGNGANNTLWGNGGNDTITGGSGQDAMDGGSGVDTIDYLYWTGGGTYNLATGVASFAGFYDETIANFENIWTGAGADSIVGTTGANNISSGDGNDTVDAGNGNDVVSLGGGDDYVNTTADGNDTYYSGSGNDYIWGGSGNELYYGEDGNDTLLGYYGNDSLSGGSGSDSIDGQGGNDTIRGDGEQDTLSGGDGIDTLDYTVWSGGGTYNLASGVASFAGFYNETITSFENIWTGSGADSVIGSAAANVITTGAGNDTVSGGAGNDSVSLGDGDDYVNDTSGGNDTFDGGTGNDFIYGYTGNESYVGGEGNDTLLGDAGNDTLLGNYGDDSLNGGTGDDDLRGGGGNDIIDGGSGIDTASYALATSGVTVSLAVTTAQNTGSTSSGTDTLLNIEKLLGSVYNDVLTGSTAANVIDAGSGNDKLFGNGGNDSLIGGAGNDTLDGNAGNDTMAGGTGNDTYVVNATGDQAVEAAGAGTDLVNSSVTWTLAANLEKLTLTGSGAINGTGNGLANTMTGNGAANQLTGLGGNDTLIGNGGNDKLFGGDGGDNLQGGAGNDSLDGGAGGDRLTGGAGADTLIGGAGNDIFDYNALADSDTVAGHRDVINDFAGVGATLLDRIDFQDVFGGVLTFIGTAAFSAVGQVRVGASGTDSLIQVNTVGASGAEMEILVHDGAILPSQWVAGDFLL